MGDRYREQHGKPKRERQSSVSKLLSGVDDMRIDDSLGTDVRYSSNSYENVSLHITKFSFFLLLL